MYCRCALYATAIKHQEHITVASVNGNHISYMYMLYLQQSQQNV